MSQQQPPDLRALRGLVATVCTSGLVDPDFAAHLSEMRSWCDRNGFHSIEWRTFPAALVEAGRDAVVEHALRERYDWLMQIDADAAPFPADACRRLLEDAYVRVPDADVVGAYAQLKGGMYIPTIDTGTGTWEPWFPGAGLIPVIRTGGHFFLAKCSAFRKFGPPWFRTRLAPRAIDAFAEVDGFARQQLHGTNPFRGAEWDRLVAAAAASSGGGPSSVGEDSGFCDALKAAGGNIYVDTDLVVGHMSRKAIMPSDLKEALDKRRALVRSACGVCR